MRHDYGLYLIAIICFVLAGFLFMGHAGYIELTIGNEATDLVITSDLVKKNISSKLQGSYFNY